MLLSKKQEKFLRALGHNKKPVIWLGQHGLTDNVVTEIESALEHHELIKIKLRVGDRDTRDATIEDICSLTGADQVQKIGNIVTLYRKNTKKPGIRLPRD